MRIYIPNFEFLENEKKNEKVKTYTDPTKSLPISKLNIFTSNIAIKMIFEVISNDYKFFSPKVKTVIGPF